MAKQKVLLVYPDFVEVRGATQMKGSYSEGLASISAVLKEGGHHVSLFHMNTPLGKDRYIREIKGFDADIIGITAWTYVYPHVKELVRWTREATDALIVCGGYHATLAPEEVIAAEGIDALCIGEGEYPLLDLCNNLDSDSNIYGIESLWFRRGEQVIRNPVRCYPDNLDLLPIPDFELFDFENFLSSRIKTALVMLSRGCVFNCTYCANPQLREIYPNRGSYARFKSPQRSIEYLRAILDRYPFIKYFNFMDSILPLKRAWFMEFIELYRSEINLPFNCRLRSDLLDEEIVARLKEAKCYLAHLGIESGDEELRYKYLSRRMSDQQIIDSFRWLNQYKIPTLTYNIVGLPHETPQKALKTIKLNVRVGAKRTITSIFFPYPNTRLAEISREAGFIGEEVDYTALAVLKQPQFKRYEVIFAHRYFRAFTAFYRLAFKLPRPFSRWAERFFDWLFCTKLLPRRFLVGLHFAWAGFLSATKRIFMRVAPQPYLALRNILIRLRTGKEKSNLAA
jgi:anaerobic magnesium-protoporphyrin IX monomethyl ester cyclase